MDFLGLRTKRGFVMPKSFLWLLLTMLPLGASAQHSTPVWARPDLFWYYKNISGSPVFLKVDVLHGVKEPLFDHQRLAIELTLRTGNEYTPTTLPFADPALQFVVKYDGSNAYIQVGAMAIEFVLGSTQWRCDLQIKWNWNLVPPTDYECLPRRPVQPGQSLPVNAAALPRVSPNGKWEAFIENGNVAIRPVGESSARPTLLSSDGSAAIAYQPGSLRWSADSRTLSAYKVNPEVWLTDALSGNVKKHITRGEWTEPFTKR
jgi:hypothetical protein